jgi:hypothetical protein
MAQRDRLEPLANHPQVRQEGSGALARPLLLQLLLSKSLASNRRLFARQNWRLCFQNKSVQDVVDGCDPSRIHLRFANGSSEELYLYFMRSLCEYKKKVSKSQESAPRARSKSK